MVHIKFFQELSKKDVGIAGGKGASLGEMTRTGILVPPGFVICADAFDRFLTETDLNVEVEAALDGLNHEDVNAVEDASERLRSLIISATMPKDLQKEIVATHKQLGQKSNVKSQKLLVAVRSSATAEDSSTASWAGELESYLNTTPKMLLANVQNCWSSLFTPRAIVYRKEKNMHKTKVSVAVVVQKMVQAEVAGVCFTVHPVTQDKHQLIAEAVWGLGEYIVGGVVTPDSYVVDKRDWSLLDVNVAGQEVMLVRKPSDGNIEKKVPAAKKAKQKLSGREIIELAKLCAKIEKHYKFPCDIEWARENGKFYVVQSRPITTL